MSVSIVIPVLDDNKELAGLLRSIRLWDEQPLEMIVVDAKADEQCQKLCHEFNARWIAYGQSRGAQLRFGAQHASGDTVWFVYADCRPPDNSIALINQAMVNNKGGFFKFAFNLENKTLSQKIIEFFINWRCKHFMVYGDQGLFFDKQAYFVLDGHADQTLFEEVNLVKKIKSLGFKQINSEIKVSPRKWQNDGFWQRTYKNRLIAIRHLLGTPIDTLKKQYYS